MKASSGRLPAMPFSTTSRDRTSSCNSRISQRWRADVVELGRKLAKRSRLSPDEVIDKLAQVIADMPVDWLDEVVEDFDVPASEK
jgi:hypothetical protein